MRRRLVWFLSALLLLMVFPVGAVVAAPVLANQGFETGSTSGWASWGSAQAGTAYKYGGSYGLRLGPSSGVEQVITGLSPNTYYKLSAMLKVEAAPNMIILGVKEYGNPELSVSSTGIYYDSPKSVTFKTGPSNTTAKIYLFKSSSASGYGYADSVEVAEISPPSPPTLDPVSPYIDSSHPITVNNWKGVTWDPLQLANGMYDANGISSDINNMKYAGVHWVRVWTGPSESAAVLDQKIAALQNAGMQAFIFFSKGNKTYGTPQEEAQTAAFLTNLVNTYKNYIKYWEIGNEPNLESYWDLGGRVGEGTSDPDAPFNAGVHRYVLHLQNCYNAIKAADPNAVVLSAGLSSYMYKDFMDRMTAEQAYLYFDEFAFHPYEKTPDLAVSVLDTVRSKISTWPAPHNNKPIWVTEIGWDTTPYDESYKAAFLTEGMKKIVQNMKSVRPVVWYALHEKSSASGFGLTQRRYIDSVLQYDRLPAIENYRALNDHLPVVENAGFETGDTLNWSTYGTTAADSTNPMYGSYGLKVSKSSGAEQVIRNLFPNTTYTLTVMVKASSGSDTASITVKNYGGSDLIASTTSTTYTSKSITFTTGANNYSARIALYKGSASGSGYGYFDTVQLVKQ